MIRSALALRDALPAVFAVLFVSACADKVYAPPRAATPTIPVMIAMQGTPGTRVVRVRADYERTGGTRVLIKEEQFAAQVGEQQISLSLDLTSCLADSLRAGTRTGCDLRLGIGLFDSVSVLLDTLSLGPFTAAPGRALEVVDASLATQRFAVREWLAEHALRLGGPDGPPTIRTISGYTTQSGVPVPLALRTGVDETGQSRGSLYSIEGGAWRRLASLPGSFLTDVFGISATESWVAATTGLYRFDGTSLVPVASITDSLFAVSARVVGGSRLVVAAGVGGALWTGNGTTWQSHAGTGERFTDACVSSLTEAYAGTQSGNIYRFDGTAWTQTPAPFPAPKFGMQCPGPGQAFAFDTLSLLTWTGTTWGPAPNPGQPYRITWAVPDGGASMLLAGIREDFGGSFETVMWRFVNGTWSQTGTVPFGQPFASNAMWASASGTGYLANSSFGRIVTLGAGAPAVVSYLPALRDVYVASPTSAVAVGWNMFLARWNGSRWTIDPPPAGIRRVLVMHGVWSDGPNNIWVVGNAPVALHWNGSTWNTVFTPSDNVFGSALAGPHDVWGTGNTVFMAGTQLIRCTGEQCTADASSPGGVHMYSVWGSSATNVFAVGELGTIVRFDGTSWTQMASPTARNLRNVWGSGPNDVWALGDSVLVRYDGTSWQTIPATGALLEVMTGPSPTQAIVRPGLWVGGPGEVYVGGDNGRIARYNGYTWQLMSTPTTRRIIAIHGLPGLGALAIGDSFAAHAGPTMLRGAGVTGTFGTAMPPPITWY